MAAAWLCSAAMVFGLTVVMRLVTDRMPLPSWAASPDHERFVATYPVDESPWEDYSRNVFGPARIRRLPELIDRFDWIVDFKAAYDADVFTGINRRRGADPRTVLCGAHPLGLQTLLAEARGLDPEGRSRRSVVFAGSVLHLSEAFGRGVAREAVVQELLLFFGRVLYSRRDVDVEGIRTMPVGLAEQYYRRTSGELLSAIEAASEDEAKTGMVLAAWGAFTPFAPRDVAGLENSTRRILQLEAGVTGYKVGSYAAEVSRAQAMRWLASPAVEAVGAHRVSLRQAELYRETARHRFVLSPMGNGISRSQIVESLLLLTVPIVQRGPYPVFDDYVRWGFPIVVVDEWWEITPEALGRWWRELKPRLRRFRDRCLTADTYWRFILGEIESCEH